MKGARTTQGSGDRIWAAQASGYRKIECAYSTCALPAPESRPTLLPRLNV